MWFRDHELFAGFLRENRWELLTLLVLAGLLSGGAVYYTQQSNLSPVIREERGALKLEQVVIDDYRLDLKRWRMRGERAIVLETSRRMRIEQVRIEVFVPYSAAVNDPKVNLYISANEALAEWQDQQITLLGDVKIRHDTGLGQRQRRRPGHRVARPAQSSRPGQDRRTRWLQRTPGDLRTA
jgi:type II secretory pathway pseudopilin PulG